jgi:glycosyltransferase involved in cell wall biosynthesis
MMAGVIVCSWEGDDAELTLAAARAAVDQAGTGRAILVDMCRDDRIVRPAGAIDGLVVRHVSGSAGLAESRQLGLEASAERYVAFLDSDAVPHPGWLDALLAAVRPSDVAVAGGPVLPLWPDRRPPALFRTRPAGDFLSMLDLGPARRDVPRVLPGNMIVDRELTGELVFSAHMGRSGADLLGAEEIEMMLRVADRGLRVVYEPAAAVHHHTRAERMTWRWMWRRVEAAGRESAANRRALEPLPRPVSIADRAFLAAVAPAYVLGRLRGSGRRKVISR